MRFLLKVLVAIAAVLAVTAVAVHFLVPPDLVRERIAAAVKEQTGRTLQVAGDASLSLYPSLGVELTNVSLSNPPDMAEGEMLRMESLKLGLAILPLLSRQIAVDRFILIQPVIRLTRDPEGRTNWRFDPPREAAAVRRPRAVSAQADGEKPVRGLTLADVRIEDGTIHYTDARSGAEHMAEAVNITLSLPSLDDPLDADGTFRWKGEPVTLDARVEKPQALRAGGGSHISFKAEAPNLNAAFVGEIVPGDDLRFAGDLTASSPSVRAVLDWLGDGAPTKEGFGAARMSGRLSGGGDEYALQQAKISFDGMNGQGQAVLATGGARPHLRAALALDRLIVDPYLSGPPAERRAAAPARARPVAAQAAGEDGLTDFIEQLDDEPAAEEPAAPGAPAPAESMAPKSPAPAPAPEAAAAQASEAAGLRDLDADVNLNVGGIAVKRIQIGKSIVEAKLREGVLDATLRETALYGGKGSGAMRYDASGTEPHLKANLSLSDVSALPLLQDAAQFAWISGRAQVQFDLAGRGKNGDELTRTLNGQGSVRFTDGAIEGVNIPQMLRALKAGDTNWRSQESMRTDFSELSGSFTMQDGVATTNDISLLSPLLRVSAKGDIDLNRRWLDLEATPTIVASLEGQGGDAATSGIMIPFDIEGPWSDPSYKPDLKRLLEDPEATAQTIDALREQFKDIKAKDVGRILDGLLGGGRGNPPPAEDEPPAADGEGEAEPQEVRPRDLLKQFLR